MIIRNHLGTQYLVCPLVPMDQSGAKEDPMAKQKSNTPTISNSLFRAMMAALTHVKGEVDTISFPESEFQFDGKGRWVIVHVTTTKAEIYEVFVYMVKGSGGSWQSIESFVTQEGSWTMSTQKFDARNIKYYSSDNRSTWGQRNADAVGHLNAGRQFRIIGEQLDQLSDDYVLTVGDLYDYDLSVEIAIPQGRDEAEWEYFSFPFRIFIQTTGQEFKGFTGFIPGDDQQDSFWETSVGSITEFRAWLTENFGEQCLGLFDTGWLKYSARTWTYEVAGVPIEVGFRENRHQLQLADEYIKKFGHWPTSVEDVRKDNPSNRFRALELVIFYHLRQWSDRVSHLSSWIAGNTENSVMPNWSFGFTTEDLLAAVRAFSEDPVAVKTTPVSWPNGQGTDYRDRFVYRDPETGKIFKATRKKSFNTWPHQLFGGDENFSGDAEAYRQMWG